MRGILSTIGHTPLVPLQKICQELPLSIYAKLEMFNPGGSIKDRPALNMLFKLLENGQIHKDTTIIESSSGNMAIGLAQVCRYIGLKLIVVVDPKINRHTLGILQAYGACIEKVTEADTEGNYLAARLQRVNEFCDEIAHSFWPNQYKNEHNTSAHYQTMHEIVDALPEPPDYVLASTSTCGTIMGCARYVKQKGLDTKMVAVDAAGSVIFGTEAGNRLVPGHGAGRPSDLLDATLIDHVFHITDEECINGCKQLLNREAILAGGSSGAVVMAAKKLGKDIPKGSSCVLILPDSGERYLDTIYNNDWIEKHFGGPKKKTQHTFPIDRTDLKRKNKVGAKQQDEPFKIAIIGGGPKGIYGFERLAAQFKAHPPTSKVEIHVYNKSLHFGAGDIYHPHQPDYLLLNNPAGDINMWIDELPEAVIDEPLSLTEWLQINHNENISNPDYVSRKLVGKYLTNGVEEIATNLPKNVHGEYLIGEVTDILKKNSKYDIKLESPAGHTQEISHQYDHILLATGHPQNQLGEQEKALQEYSVDKNDTDYVPFIYPVETKLSSISPRAKVGIKGIGLTFIDAVLALTEGRGGEFRQHAKNGRLIYKPSGKEPQKMYPFSRSGLPMLPRGPAPENQTPLKFFTPLALNELRKDQPERKLSFKEELLPLLKQELVFAFYDVEMKQTGFKNDLASCSTFAEVNYYISLYHKQHADHNTFDPEPFLRPLKGKAFEEGKAFHKFVCNYLVFFLKEARKGELQSPWAAVTAVWRKITSFFGTYYGFGGLMPESQRYFDRSFRRLLNRVTFGPPVESVEKLIALIEAGLVSFEMAQHPDIQMDREKGLFLLISPQFNRNAPIDAVIDARISKVSLHDDDALLYRNMLRRGLISMYKNEFGQELYQPGCIALSPKGFVINDEGIINQSIAVTGTPTEGITFDNDALSRTRNNFVSGWAAYVQQSHEKSKTESYAR